MNPLGKYDIVTLGTEYTSDSKKVVKTRAFLFYLEPGERL